MKNVELLTSIINIIENETGMKELKAESKLSDLKIDSISFVTILIKIEESHNVCFDNNIIAMSECENITTLVEFTLKQKKGTNNGK